MVLGPYSRPDGNVGIPSDHQVDVVCMNFRVPQTVEAKRWRKLFGFCKVAERLGVGSLRCNQRAGISNGRCGLVHADVSGSHEGSRVHSQKSNAETNDQNGDQTQDDARGPQICFSSIHDQPVTTVASVTAKRRDRE